MSCPPSSSDQGITLSNPFNGLIPYVYDTSTPEDYATDTPSDFPVDPTNDRLEPSGWFVDIDGASSTPASSMSSRQRTRESKMQFSGSRPKGRHKS